MEQTPEDISELDERINAAKGKNISPRQTKTQLFSSMAFQATIEFISPVIVGICLGYTADLVLGTKPLVTIIMMIFGCMSGVWNLYKMGKKFEEETEE